MLVAREHSASAELLDGLGEVDFLLPDTRAYPIATVGRHAGQASAGPSEWNGTPHS